MRYDEVIAPALVGLEETCHSPYHEFFYDVQLCYNVGANMTENKKWPWFEPINLELGVSDQNSSHRLNKGTLPQASYKFAAKMLLQKWRLNSVKWTLANIRSSIFPESEVPWTWVQDGDVGVIEIYRNTEFYLSRSKVHKDKRGQNFKFSKPCISKNK